MKYLYPELSPKLRFTKILELHILPKLENQGFKLLKTGPSLKKVQNGFEFHIIFEGRKFNVENYICRFNPSFYVTNSSLRKYLKKNPSLLGGSEIVGKTMGIQHWDKSIFSNNDSEAYFLEDNDFAKYDNEFLVKETIKNIIEVGNPFFEMMSNFETIKKFHFKNQNLVSAPMLIDLCYVLNLKNEIQPIFDWYYSLNDGCSELLEEKMKLRKDNLKKGID
ncbi:MAG: hypothetical protein ACPG4Y_03840 [Chitinophagales bacterium]